jgi:hypothetical protein
MSICSDSLLIYTILFLTFDRQLQIVNNLILNIHIFIMNHQLLLTWLLSFYVILRCV